MKKLFALFIIILSTSIAYASDVTADNYGDMKIKAISLYDNANYLEAYELFMALFRENPTDKSLYAYIGRSAKGAKRYNQAIMGYERAIDVNPNSAILHVELASVYNAVQNYEQAKQLLIIAEQLGASEKGIDIKGIIAVVDNKLSTSFFSGIVALGVGYDSNVNFGVISRDIVLGGLPFTLSESSLPQSSPLLVASGFINYLEKFSPSNDTIALVADVGVYTRLFSERNVSRNNFMWVGGNVGARLLFDKSFLDILAKGSYTSYDLYSNIASFGGGVEYTALLPKRITSFTLLSFELKEYDKSIDNNGYYINAKQRFNFRLYEKGSLSAQIHYAHKQASITRYTYDLYGGKLTYMQALPFKIYLRPSVRVDYSAYQGLGTIFDNANRADTSLYASVDVIWRFLNDFAFNVEYGYEYNDSNSSVYTYHQHVIEATISYRF